MLHPALRARLGSILLLASIAAAQQANSPSATMYFDFSNLPTGPIVGVPLLRPGTHTVTLLGDSGAPFVVGSSAGVRAAGLPVPGGLLDLNLVGYSTVLDGTVNPAFSLDPFTADFYLTFTLPAAAPLFTSRAYQAALADVTAPSGYTLSAATQVIVVGGVTTTTLNLGNEDSLNFSFQSAGFTVPFYGGAYSSIWVNANGSLSFLAGSSQSVPTSLSFLSGPPRIAGFWTDLSPGAGGLIRMTVDESAAPFVRCEFLGVPEAGSGASHGFTITIASNTGDILIAENAQTGQAQFPALVGITPGSNLSTAPSKDLSSLTLANFPNGGVFGGLEGAVNENFHELFPAGAGWDLSGRTLRLNAINAGWPDARYRGRILP